MDLRRTSLSALYLHRPGYRLGGMTRSFRDELGGASLYLYAFARHALCAGLEAAGIKSGDKVLLPALICRDVLSSIHAVGAIPIFYRVNRQLELEEAPDALPKAHAVVAVNYFGFAQDLAPFRHYADRAGALLVEDNAHGLFSRDDAGRLLGTRGHIGLFSFRKSMPLINGAGLLVNDATRFKTQVVGDAFEEVGFKERLRFSVKNALAHSAPVLGNLPVRTAVRLLGGGPVEDNEDATSESILPSPVRAPKDLPERLASFAWQEDVERRRALYDGVERFLAGTGIQAVFPKLPAQTAPYMYCFYMTPEQRTDVASRLGKAGLRLIRWPDLPTAGRETFPAFYSQIWAVPFLW